MTDRILWHSLDYWESRMEDCLLELKARDWNSIPCLNWIPLHELANHQLVRFKGMVQDMYNPEFYFSKYETVNKNTGQSLIRSGMYRDRILCEEHEDFISDSAHNTYGDRFKFYCVTIPGINSWVTDFEQKLCGKPGSDESMCSDQQNCKRSLSIDEVSTSDSSTDTVPKRIRTDTGIASHTDSTEMSVSLPEPNLNFPISSQKGIACILKIYEKESILLNDIIEVAGFLSLDDNAQPQDDFDTMDTDDSGPQNPCRPVVPTLHCVVVKKVTHCNPLLDNHPSISENIFEIADSVRKDLHLVLTQLLLGDTLAADYLLCHLLSSVFQRNDLLAVGKLCLNISNIPTDCDYAKHLYEILMMLVPKSHFLPMSLENLNKQTFVPMKDYSTDRLKSGILQLSANTHLVLDETQLQPGQLDSNGVANVTALKTLIAEQKLDYDFKYHKSEFSTDIPVLIFSEGKSLLSSDAEVVLLPTQDHAVESYAAAKHYLSQNSLLEKIRTYLTTMRHAEYSVPPSMEEMIQTTFLDLRKEDRSKMSGDDLHLLLIIARVKKPENGHDKGLLALSKGKQYLDEEIWKNALEMEQERKERLPVRHPQ